MAEPGKPKDIFAAIAAKASAAPPVEDTELLLVGGKQAGKSTLIHNFLMKDDTAKPTTALEYRFARRSTGTNNATTVANIWELGGGTQLSDLLKVVVLPERISRCVVGITLDMSSPGEALETLTYWLAALRKHVEAAMAELRGSASGEAELAAISARNAETWAEHPDADQVRPMGVALVIFANKWDAFEEANGETEYRKLATRTLRHLAHLNGASLVCSKHKDKQLMTVVRNVLYHHVFGTAAVKVVQLEHNRPVVAPAGADSFGGIGKAPLVEGCLATGADERWKAAFEATFPIKQKQREAQDLSLVESEQFAEEVVDELRRQKRAEVEKLRREARLQAEAEAIDAINAAKPVN